MNKYLVIYLSTKKIECIIMFWWVLVLLFVHLTNRLASTFNCTLYHAFTHPNFSYLNWMVGLEVRLHSQLNFLSKTWFLVIYLNFHWQELCKIQYLPHLTSKSYKIYSIKSYSLKSFQQHQRHIPILLKFSIMI